MRMPYFGASGQHGFTWPNYTQSFDPAFYAINQIGAYFYFDGKCITDDPCLRDVGMEGCDWLFDGSHPADCQ